jgi:hypothetical protein
MFPILAAAVLFPCGSNPRKVRFGPAMYKPIPPGTPVARQCLLPLPGTVSTSSRIAPMRRDLQHNMRLIARFVFIMIAVFGVSLAFAWAWDKSDKPRDAVVSH